MQVYTNSKRDSIKTFLFFLIILFIAYLPVSSFLFFLKNDAFNGYFPPKFFMSESIHSGYLPMWNPYINFGLPQYGDMSSGFWSPITWLMASTIGYNAYSFTIELLLYILTAGIGMYLLCRFYSLNKQVCLIAGLSYMCCGYMIGHLQHFNWISGAAFLPLCIWSYHKLQVQFSIRNVLTASLLFYLLASSAHPGITIGALYFFIGYALFVFFKENREKKIQQKISSFTTTTIILLIGIGLLSVGMIAGYADILPNITRGEKVGLMAIENPVTIESFLSAALPVSIVKNDHFFSTDISMRNIYIGLTLFLFLIVSLFTKKNSYQKFYLITGFIFFLLSTDTIFKTIAFKYLPLIGYVRLNGEFAIFGLLSFIITAAFTLDHFILSKASFKGSLKIIYYILEILFFIGIGFGIYKSTQTHESFIYQLKNIFTQEGIVQKLKLFIDSISFYDSFWLQGMIQLIMLWCIKWCLINRNFTRLLKIAIADLVIASLLNIPFTGVGKASVAEVQSVLNKSPKGIIIPALKPINQLDTISNYESGLVGNWSFYNKQPGVDKFAFYPVELNNTKLVFNDSTAEWFNKPVVFNSPDTTVTNLIITKFNGSSISIITNSNNDHQLVFQQNSYPHWYVLNNNQKSIPGNYRSIFLSTSVKTGTNNIQFIFDPSLIKKAMLFSAIAFIIYIIILLILFIRSPSPSSQR